jgi:hypothetical protein
MATPRNITGKMVYTHNGFPVEVIEDNSLDIGKLTYWDDGMPVNYSFSQESTPTSGTLSARRWCGFFMFGA